MVGCVKGARAKQRQDGELAARGSCTGLKVSRLKLAACSASWVDPQPTPASSPSLPCFVPFPQASPAAPGAAASASPAAASSPGSGPPASLLLMAQCKASLSVCMLLLLKEYLKAAYSINSERIVAFATGGWLAGWAGVRLRV